MKNIISLIMAGLVVSCTTTQKSTSDPQSQQKTPNVVVVDYKNIAQDHEEDYLKVEKFWKPVHQERSNDGTESDVIWIGRSAACPYIYRISHLRP